LDILNKSNINILSIKDEEKEFFERFLSSKNIFWDNNDRANNIIRLSNSYVGYIRTPLRKIELPPKYKEINIEHVLRLYNYIYAYKDDSDDELLNIVKSQNSVEKLFINLLRKEMQLGIIREYKEVKYQGESIKGKVNYKQTFINSKLFRKNPVTSNIYSLNLDNNINRLIVGALTKLLNSNKYKMQCLELLSYFEDVTPIKQNATLELNKIVFNSNNIRYKQVLIKASMIIDSLFFDDLKGSIGGESFLINFDLLFEMFIRKVLRDVTKKSEFIFLNDGLKFAEVINNFNISKSRFYKPDVLYKFESESPNNRYQPAAVGVLDVKNKAYNVFSNADIYQIIVYSNLLDSKYSILIYPSFFEKSSETLFIYNDNINKNEIKAVFINIAESDSTQFKNSINLFIDKIYEALS